MPENTAGRNLVLGRRVDGKFWLSCFKQFQLHGQMLWDSFSYVHVVGFRFLFDHRQELASISHQSKDSRKLPLVQFYLCQTRIRIAFIAA